MTFQDFKAASQGDQRLATAKWCVFIYNQRLHKEDREYASWCSQLTEQDLHRWHGGAFDCADAVLAELDRQREGSV